MKKFFFVLFAFAACQSQNTEALQKELDSLDKDHHGNELILNIHRGPNGFKDFSNDTSALARDIVQQRDSLINANQKIEARRKELRERLGKKE